MRQRVKAEKNVERQKSEVKTHQVEAIARAKARRGKRSRARNTARSEHKGPRAA